LIESGKPSAGCQRLLTTHKGKGSPPNNWLMCPESCLPTAAIVC
jgi:hypothetical protein